MKGCSKGCTFQYTWPFEVSILGGSKYFISFIDGHTRMLWLYTIKLKSEAFEVYKTLIEKEDGK